MFAIEAGVPCGALYVESSGHIGIGTTDPAKELEIVDGNTPTLRLRQDTTHGFSQRTWDVGGNESGFFIRDVTAGNNQVLRILPDANKNGLVVGRIGVGVGLSNAAALLHVRSLGGSGKLLVDVGSSDNTPADPRFIGDFRNKGASAVQIVDTSAGQSYWAFQSQAGPAAGDATFKLTNSFGPGDEFVLQADGDLFITGALTERSDRNAKMAIVPVDPAEILEIVSALPVSAWSCNHDTSGARPLGPMAQDFHAIFGLGERDTGISTLDSSGVALAAIKALHPEKINQKAVIAELSELTRVLAAQNADLAARLAALEHSLD